MTDTETADRRRWLALAVIVAAQFMVVLDVAIVNVALPSIKTDLHFSQESLQWVITAYSIFFGGVLLLGGRLGTLDGDGVQGLDHQALIRHIGAGHGNGQRHPTAIDERRTLHAQLAAIGRVFAGFFLPGRLPGPGAQRIIACMAHAISSVTTSRRLGHVAALRFIRASRRGQGSRQGRQRGGEAALANLAPNQLMNPQSIAETYWQLYNQPRDAWTFELDLRPHGEVW